MKDFSPEERLLRLIRSKTSKQPSPVPQETAPITQKAAPLSLKGFFTIGRFRFNWENLNLALTFFLVVLLACLMPLFSRRPRNSIEELEKKTMVHQKAVTPKTEEPQRPSFEYFLEPAASKNIFSPLIREEVQPQAPVEEGPRLEDIKGQLSLLGVIGGASPQAIIEDKKTQKTYFLNKGSTFDEIEVSEILEDKVILIYKGKQFELAL